MEPYYQRTHYSVTPTAYKCLQNSATCINIVYGCFLAQSIYAYAALK